VRTTILLASCCAAALPLLCTAQGSMPLHELGCVGALELPTRSILSARAVTSGTVIVTVQVGIDGKAAQIDMLGESAALKGEVQVAMTLSTFLPKCAGKKLELVFAFKLEDPPSESILPPGVRYMPPNRFELIVRKVKANQDAAVPLPKR